jgi:hypothetical protein
MPGNADLNYEILLYTYWQGHGAIGILTAGRNTK